MYQFTIGFAVALTVIQAVCIIRIVRLRAEHTYEELSPKDKRWHDLMEIAKDYGGVK